MACFRGKQKQLQRPLYSGNLPIEHFCNMDINWKEIYNLNSNSQPDFLPATKFWYQEMYLVIGPYQKYVILPIYFTYCK
jgi:hypothetical protein